MKRFSFLLLLAVSLAGCPSGDTPGEPPTSEEGSSDESAAEPAADEAAPTPEPAEEPASQPAADSAAGAENQAARDELIRAANPSGVQLQQPQLRLETRGMGRELRLSPNARGAAATPTLELQPAGE